MGDEVVPSVSVPQPAGGLPSQVPNQPPSMDDLWNQAQKPTPAPSMDDLWSQAGGQPSPAPTP